MKIYHLEKNKFGYNFANLSLLRSIRRKFRTFNVMYASTYNGNVIDMEISDVYVFLEGSPVLYGIFLTF